MTPNVDYTTAVRIIKQRSKSRKKVNNRNLRIKSASHHHLENPPVKTAPLTVQNPSPGHFSTIPSHPLVSSKCVISQMGAKFFRVREFFTLARDLLGGMVITKRQLGSLTWASSIETTSCRPKYRWDRPCPILPPSVRCQSRRSHSKRS